MHLLAARPLADDLDDALWTENDADALAWFVREMPREIMQAIPAHCHREFLAGAYQRYFDSFV